MSDNILGLGGVGHRFGGLTVLRSVTLVVPEGGLVGLIGPNGSGKTTLFNIISGYLPLQAGTIAFRGRALTTQSIQDRSRAGMVLAALCMTAAGSCTSSSRFIRSMSRPTVSPDFRRKRRVDQIR